MREQRRGLEDGPRGDVYAERLDNRLYVFECVPNRVGVEGDRRYTFSRFVFWIGILAAERASARTLCPARRAAFTVSIPDASTLRL